MKTIITITLILGVLALSLMGCLVIFDVMSMESAMTNLMQIEAGLFLLGGCSVLILLLLGAKKSEVDD